MNIYQKCYELQGCEAEIAFVVDEGMRNFICLNDEKRVPYSDIGLGNFPPKGSGPALVFGTHVGKKVVIATRLSFKYGGDNLRLYHYLESVGVKTVISIIGVEPLSDEDVPSPLMLIKDHINLSCKINHVRIKGANMINAYDKSLRTTAKNIAKNLNINIWEGVHMQVEDARHITLAEEKIYRMFGADSLSETGAIDNIFAVSQKMKFLCFAHIKGLPSRYTGDYPERAEGVDLERFTRFFSELLKAI